MNIINTLQKNIYDMQPAGIAVKICAAIPIVSNIVLLVKEKQLIKIVNDNYYDVEKITDSVEYNKNLDDISQKTIRCIRHLKIYDDFVSTMSVSIYSYVPRISLIWILIIVPLSVPVWWGTAAILGLTLIHPSSVYFPSHQKYLNYQQTYIDKFGEAQKKLEELKKTPI